MNDKELELQKKQLFAQRATAVAAALTALNTAAAAESVEQMRQEASDAALAASRHQNTLELLQQAQLAVIGKHAQAEAEDREYQHRVLFLKESDDPTRLDSYCQMLVGKLSGIYVDPPWPKECQAGGTITMELKALTAAGPKYNPQPLPEEGVQLQSKITECIFKIYKAQQIISKNTTVLPVVGSVFGALLILMGIANASSGAITKSSDSLGVAILLELLNGLFFFGGGGLLIVNLTRKRIRAAKALKEISIIQFNLTRLKIDMEPIRKEVEAVNSQIKAEAEHHFLNSVDDSFSRWRSLVESALIEDFFSQRLWVENASFVDRIKAALIEVQKPFPTSCRVDVNKLSADQITSTYATFTEEVVKRMCERIPSEISGGTRGRILDALRRGPIPQGASL